MFFTLLSIFYYLGREKYDAKHIFEKFSISTIDLILLGLEF